MWIPKLDGAKFGFYLGDPPEVYWFDHSKYEVRKPPQPNRKQRRTEASKKRHRK